MAGATFRVVVHGVRFASAERTLHKKLGDLDPPVDLTFLIVRSDAQAAKDAIEEAMVMEDLIFERAEVLD